ncbi:MAG: cation:proton antiporter [archaeon]
MDLSILIDLGLIVVAATIFGYIARLLKQPSLLAYILAGIVLGPIGLGALGYSFQGVRIGISNMQDIRILSELGIAFLLFSVGVEIDIRKFLGMGKIAAMGATLQVVLTIGTVMLFSLLFPGIISFEQSVFLGVILSFSSTMVVVKLLGDSYQINTLHGRLLIGFLLMQDLLVILAIPLLQDIETALSPAFLPLVVVKVAVLVAAAAVINRHILPRMFRFSLNYQEEFYLAALSSCFIFIGLAILMNLPIAIGAFIGGLALSTLPYNTEIFNKIRGLRDFFVILFFVSLGMQLTPSFAAVPFALIAFIIATVLVIKPVIYYFITLFSGYGSRISVMVALGLANISEFSLIVAQMGFDPTSPATSVLSEGLFSLTILTITVSMVLAPYLMGAQNGVNRAFDKAARHLPKKIKRKRFTAKLSSLENTPSKLCNHILILGGGTMGSNIAKALYKHYPTLVLDQDSEVVYSCMRQGIKASYCDAEETNELEKANPKEAKLVILAIPNIKASLKTLRFVKKANKNTPVFARAHYYKDALKLYEAGADFVCMPHVIGGNVFLKEISKFLESGKLATIANLENEYMEYLKQKAKEERQHLEF